MPILAAALCAVLVQEGGLDSRIREFAESIDPAGDENADVFRAAMQSTVGRIALRDRLDAVEAELRREAERHAIPAWVRERFIEKDGRLSLRPEMDGWRRNFLDDQELYRADMASVGAVLKEIADGLVGDGEAEKALRRFLSTELGPHAVYLSAVRTRLRPDVAALERRLGRVIAPDGKGGYRVPESRRAEVEAALAQFQRKQKALDRVAASLRRNAEGLSQADELHRGLAAAMKDPLLAAVVARDAARADDASVLERFATEYDKALPGAFEDGPDGRVLRDANRARSEETLELYGSRRKLVAALREPMRRFAERVPQDDELHRGVAKLLGLDLVLLSVAQDLGNLETDPAAACRAVMAQAVVKGEGGRYELVPGVGGGLLQGLQRLSTAIREGEARRRALGEIARRVQDGELAGALQEPGGMASVALELQDALARRTYDPLGAWIERHFEDRDGRRVARAGAAKELAAILRQTDRIIKELENDDF